MNRKQRRALKKEAKGVAGLSEKVTLLAPYPKSVIFVRKSLTRKIKIW